MGELRLFYLTTEADCRATFQFLIAMYEELPRLHGDPGEAMKGIYETMTEGVAFNIRDLDGKIIASAGFIPIKAWYGKEVILVERWLYIIPERRGDRATFDLILTQVKLICKVKAIQAVIKVFNPRRRVTSGIAKIAEEFRFSPSGDILMISPEGHGDG